MGNTTAKKAVAPEAAAPGLENDQAPSIEEAFIMHIRKLKQAASPELQTVQASGVSNPPITSKPTSRKTAAPGSGNDQAHSFSTGLVPSQPTKRISADLESAKGGAPGASEPLIISKATKKKKHAARSSPKSRAADASTSVVADEFTFIACAAKPKKPEHREPTGFSGLITAFDRYAGRFGESYDATTSTSVALTPVTAPNMSPSKFIVPSTEQEVTCNSATDIYTRDAWNMQQGEQAATPVYIASYTPEEISWLKDHFGSEHHFLQMHNDMSIYNDENRRWGRILLRLYMGGGIE